MADPRPERGAPVGASDSPAFVRLRAGRPPRPANDNVFPWLRQSAKLAPLMTAVALLAWALVHAFGGHI
ncbi:MAG TPA: hypothetical protein VGL83_01185 [Stellaceae bacterium]